LDSSSKHNHNPLNHPSNIKTYYEMKAMSKRSLIYDQHIVRVAYRVSRTTTLHKVPTRSKSGLCSRDEILVPSDRSARPLSWATSFSLHKPPQSKEKWFNKVVTKLLGLPVLIKPDMWSVQIKACPSGLK
jgi:hypothetical protein